MKFKPDEYNITGLCRIISKSNPDKAIKASSKEENVEVVTDYMSDVIQEWDIVSTKDGYYSIFNQWSGKYLTVTGTVPGSAVTVGTWTGADSQKFKLEMVDERGYFYITRKDTNYTLTKKDNSNVDDNVIFSDKSLSDKKTQWVITKLTGHFEQYYYQWGDIKPAAPGSISIKGYLGRALDRCLYGRLWDTSISVLVQPFLERNEKDTEWRGEFWGKWYTSLILAYRYAPTTMLKNKIEAAVNDLMSTQTSDGYIGCHPLAGQVLTNSGWDIWERKYVLLGLLGYYDLTGDKNVLNAAESEQNYLQTQIGTGLKDISNIGCWDGVASGSILEPVMQLYYRSNKGEYLNFANYIVSQWELVKPCLISKAIDNIEPKNINSKSYESMSCYEGLIELYNETQNIDYKNAAINYYNGIQEHEMTIIGSSGGLDDVGEQWDGCRDKQAFYQGEVNETCITATILKFCKQLYRMTGDPKYMDQIEITTYNALLASMKMDGSYFTHQMPLNGIRTSAATQCGMPLDCCVANAPRALFLIPELIVMKDDNGPLVNLFSEGSATIRVGTNDIRIDTTTQYPKNDIIIMTVYPTVSQNFTLKVRIPAWSMATHTTLKVNGATQPFESGKYVSITRTWDYGDSIELRLDLRGKYNCYHASDGNTYQALTRGPIVLARDERFNDDDITKGIEISHLDGIVMLEEITPPDNMWMAFSAPISDGSRIKLCDFASAGNDWSSKYQTWIKK